ncbi:MAG TPA: hypothetical protein VGA36_05290 [Nitriliruptorales bacterium]
MDAVSTRDEQRSVTRRDVPPAADPELPAVDPEVTTGNPESRLEQREVRRSQWSAYRYLERGPWTLSGVLALLGGLVFGVMGLVGLARAGFDYPLTSPVVTVGWLDQTAILAAGHVLLGVTLAAVGAVAARDRSGVLFVAGMLLVGGLVLLIEPGAFAELLGVTVDHGLTYIFTGSALMLAGLFAPTVSRNEQVITEHH